MADESKSYEIYLNGHLDRKWEDSFECRDIVYCLSQEGKPLTILSGELIDQSAIHGFMRNLSYIGIPIFSMSIKPNDGGEK